MHHITLGSMPGINYLWRAKKGKADINFYRGTGCRSAGWDIRESWLTVGRAWLGWGLPLRWPAGWKVCQWFPVIILLPSWFLSSSSPAVACCRPQESPATRKAFIFIEWLEGNLDVARNLWNSSDSEDGVSAEYWI